MARIVSVARAELLFCAAVGVIFLMTPINTDAQNGSLATLAGTEWSTGAITIPVYSTDNSITTLTRYLAFYSQGKVEAAFARSKSAGGEYKYVYDYVYDYGFNGATGRYEYSYVYKLVNKYVLTMPEFSSEVFKGSYQIRGQVIYLDFPAFSISATLTAGKMNAAVVNKSTKAKEGWNLYVEPPHRSNPTPRASTPTPLPRSNLSSLTGNWEGTYYCGQGVTNLILELSQSGSSEISAVFRFSANAGNPSVPSGSYRMVGTYDVTTRKITLRATDWINQPPGYYAVNLAGTVSQGNTSIFGYVTNSACTTFSLARK